MLTRHETTTGNPDIWERISAPVPASVVQWRQQGRPKQREAKWFAPFVAYIDAQFVRERLDEVVPGEWDLSLTLLPAMSATPDGEAMDEPVAFQAKLQILGVFREDVGCGKDYKTASTDAFKRAAVRFGVGHELYTDYEIVWVQVDSDSKYAKPVEDPAAAWARKANRTATAPKPVEGENGARPTERRQEAASIGKATPATTQESTSATDEPSCPKCGGRLWDNRLSKKNPKAPDYKCRSRSCDGVVWPPKPAVRTAPDLDEQEMPWERDD